MSQYSEILDRESILCPEEVSIDVGSKLTDLKMSYLVTEKADLEVELIELKQNNAMLRNINSQISIYSPTDVSVLLRRNQELEQSISKLGKEVKKIRAELFLVNQISAEDENEQRQIYKNYEDKILELRRAVHNKEISIQELEAKISGKSIKETFTIPQKSVLDYCELVSEAREKLKQTQKENQQLKEETKTLREQNESLSNKVTKMEFLLKSKYSFLDFRNSMNEKSSKSNPKQNNSFLKSKGEKHNSSHSSLPRMDAEKQNLNSSCREQNDSILYLTRHDITTVDKVIKVIRKKMNIIENLEHKNRNLVKVNEIYVAELEQLRNSNQLYQRERKQTYDKANLSRITASKMLNYISKRESSNYLFERACEYEDKDNELKLLGNKVRALEPVLLPTDLLKAEWENSKLLLEQKLKYLQVYKKQRSYSCIIDYIFHSDIAVSENVFEKDLNLGDAEDGVLFTEDEEKELEPIKSMAKRKRGKLDESFSMFENILLDL